jgi:glycine C-acetyltransferase
LEDNIDLYKRLQFQIDEIKQHGLYKEEQSITSPQKAQITLEGEQNLLNFCANNYLGLANNQEVMQAAIEGVNLYGFGMASVRFICGTQAIHKELEARISQFLETEDTILYSSCFDANCGLFETILGKEDAVLSDELNHASLIDGIRLCKAKRLRYRNNDMQDLEKQCILAKNARFRLIATDGVFSMDGTIANLKEICNLAEQYQALVVVDDSHAIGFMGRKGKGTPEFCEVMKRVDILTGTLGKALGGASGGYISGKKQLIEWLRQRSRPYLFSNALAPMIVAASLEVMDLIESGDDLRKQLHENSRYFREKMTRLNFNLVPGEHPIIPILLGEAQLAKTVAQKMLQFGIYVVAFSYPVVPQGKARIRVQISAAHKKSQLDQAIEAFRLVGKEQGII